VRRELRVDVSAAAGCSSPATTSASATATPRTGRSVAAAEIAVPVLTACGEVDVVPDPWREPAAYRGSPHVTTAVIAGMAHMHNFASARRARATAMPIE
jgi:alpha-beta hydrolase superfamily lysophospholipase